LKRKKKERKCIGQNLVSGIDKMVMVCYWLISCEWQ